MQLTRVLCPLYFLPTGSRIGGWLRQVEPPEGDAGPHAEISVVTKAGKELGRPQLLPLRDPPAPLLRLLPARVTPGENVLWTCDVLVPRDGRPTAL